MQVATDIAAAIRGLRAKLHLSQEELAQRLNVSFATVNRWENGKAQPQGTARDAINKLLDEAGGDQLVLRTADEVAEDAQPRRRKRGIARSAVLSHKPMEQMLWDSACSIRGEKDAPKFKDYILPLIFIKRLSDVFDDEVKRLVETYGDAETALEVLRPTTPSSASTSPRMPLARRQPPRAVRMAEGQDPQNSGRATDQDRPRHRQGQRGHTLRRH